MIDRRGFLSSASAVTVSTFARDADGPPPVTAGERGLTAGERLDARSRLPALATEALAVHTANVRFSDLDDGTLRQAKYRVLDLIGCALGGRPATGNDALVDLVRVQGGAPEASIIGSAFKAPAAQAAMTNGVLARAYDFEVMTVRIGDIQVPSHHSPTTCMTALAMSEREHRSGQEFLTALTIGDDLCARTLAASGLDFGQGWDGAPIYSTLGATAIAARLLKLSAQQTQDAFGLAIDTIAGTVQNIWDGATDWKLPQGLAARNAIFAAELAGRGWVGMADALQAPYGFYAQYTAGCTRPELLLAELGKAFYAEEYFKPYPACAATHPTIECALALRKNHRLAVADIESVQILMTTASLNVFVSKPFEVRRYPHCDANFSHQWQVANALLRGPVRQEHYAPGAVLSPELLMLIGKISLAQLPAGQSGFQINVRTLDGRTLSERHSGRPERNPANRGSTYEDLLAKFHQQVEFSKVIDSERAQEIVRRVSTLEHESDMARFMSRLRARPA